MYYDRCDSRQTHTDEKSPKRMWNVLRVVPVLPNLENKKGRIHQTRKKYLQY